MLNRNCSERVPSVPVRTHENVAFTPTYSASPGAIGKSSPRHAPRKNTQRRDACRVGSHFATTSMFASVRASETSLAVRYAEPYGRENQTTLVLEGSYENAREIFTPIVEFA